MTAEERQNIAAQAMCALITRQAIKFENKKQLVDNAIAYTDMLARRLAEIPADAQQRSESGQRREKGNRSGQLMGEVNGVKYYSPF